VSKLTRVKIIQWCTDLSELLCTDADDEAEVHELRDLALAALERGPGWRSMEGAPKDGSWILGWDGFSVKHINWSELFACWEDVGGFAVKPTHWQPLPTPPAAKEAEQVCKDCREVGMLHCAHPEECAGMKYKDGTTIWDRTQGSKCEHGCVDGRIRHPFSQFNPDPHETPCPIHGEGHSKPAATKPERCGHEDVNVGIAEGCPYCLMVSSPPWPMPKKKPKPAAQAQKETK